MARILESGEIWDYVTGATVLATGGGGIAPSKGRFDAAIERILESGATCTLVDPSEIPDNSTIFMKAGGGGGVESDIKRRYLAYPSYEDLFVKGFDQTRFVKAQIAARRRRIPLNTWSEIPEPQWANAAQERLQKILEVKPFAFLLSETGPNAFGIFVNAAEKGVPVVDADLTGYRAVPEASLSGLNVLDVPIAPAVFTTCWGDMLIVEKVLSWQRFEDLGRSLAAISGGALGGMMAIRGESAKKAAAGGAITKCIQLGKRIREARESGESPTETIRKYLDAYLLFEGRVMAYVVEERSGHTWGETLFEGLGDFAGRSFRIWFKNENMISWLDEKPYVTVPDSIIVVDAETGQGLSNFCRADFETDRKVTILGVRAWDLWRTERGLSIFTPRHFGIDIPYTPIEEIAGRL